jgi:hypothetical protein
MFVFALCQRLVATWKEMQQQFYQESAGTNTRDTIQKVEGLIASEAVDEVYQEGAEYLPLSVWTARGFDADAIAKNAAPEDVKNHPVLGQVYRVQLISTTTRRSRQVVRQIVGGRPDMQKRGRPGLGGTAPLAIEDGEVSPVSPARGRGSSSSSSSSSSSRKKSKKHKKDKKGKKDKKKGKKKDKKTEKDLGLKLALACRYLHE